MPEVNHGIVLGPGEGRVISVLGNEISLKVVNEDTGGAFGIMEYTAGAGFSGPPPHVHKKMIEVFYVLEGELTIHMGERRITAPTGTFALVPAGDVHTFSNPGTAPVKMLVMFSPGGFEKYFQEMPDIVAKHGFPPPPDVMAALGRKYDFEVA